MSKIKNPFVILGYSGPEYFCDREEETKQLIRFLVNGNNTVLMSPRRMGKTGLISHVFAQPEIKDEYYTFLVDIYSTKNLNDLVNALADQIIHVVASRGEKALQRFLQAVSTLRATMSFDPFGNPSWGIESGSIHYPDATLSQIFDYIEAADKPCIVAIDEFQQITYYPEKNVEATLRTKIQHCRNGLFIFSGSERSILAQMFHTPSRPFFASTSTMPLGVIPFEKYLPFIKKHFNAAGKDIDEESIRYTYDTFEGITWYIQKVMNTAYDMTERGECCVRDDIVLAIQNIIKSNTLLYKDLLYQLTPRQRDLLVAVAHEDKARELKGQTFIRRYNLSSPSSISGNVNSLLEKQLLTRNLDVYEVYDKFLRLWIVGGQK